MLGWMFSCHRLGVLHRFGTRWGCLIFILQGALGIVQLVLPAGTLDFMTLPKKACGQVTLFLRVTFFLG